MSFLFRLFEILIRVFGNVVIIRRKKCRKYDSRKENLNWVDWYLILMFFFVVFQKWEFSKITVQIELIARKKNVHDEEIAIQKRMKEHKPLIDIDCSLIYTYNFVFCSSFLFCSKWHTHTRLLKSNTQIICDKLNYIFLRNTSQHATVDLI